MKKLAILFCIALYALNCNALIKEVDKNVLRIAIMADIRSTNPGVRRDSNTDTVLHHIVESLVAFGEDLTVQPMLAKSYRVSDDGKQYTFLLREDVYFHNGIKMTAQHVKWNWERFLNPETRWAARRSFDGSYKSKGRQKGVKIESIDTPDEHTVVFHLDAPNALFLTRMADIQSISGIVHPDSVNSDGQWVHPIGTGPYKLKRWRHGISITLERFDKYRETEGERDGYAGKRAAYADEIKFIVMADPAAAMTALLSNQIDVLPGLPYNLYTGFRKNNDLSVTAGPSNSWTMLLIQDKDPLFQDIRMRKALAHAIDPDLIAEAVTYGMATINPSGVASNSRFHTARQQQRIEYNPQKARDLLKEAGYRGGAVKIQTTRKFQDRFDMALTVQAMMAAVGFNVQLEVLDWATQLNNFSNGAYQISAFAYSARPDPALAYTVIIGDKETQSWRIWGNKKAVALVDQLETAFSDEERQAIFDTIHEMMIKDIPLIGFFNPPFIVAMRKEVEGYKVWPLSKPRLWGVWKQGWNL